MIDAEEAWAAIVARDRSMDGRFVFGVATTGIYCRPSCPARHAAREHVSIYKDAEAARAAGFRACRRCLPDDVSREEEAVRRAARILEQAEGRVSLEELAAEVGYSPSHFQRVFNRALGLSPAAFARLVREERAVAALEQGGRVTDAIYDAGYESPGRFYAAMRARLGMTPSAWKRGGAGVTIGWRVVETTLGPMLLAATEAGLCRLAFNVGVEDLQQRFPHAELVEGGLPEGLVQAVLAEVEHPGGAVQDIPLDTGGTPFQQRVWAQLRQIPAGSTISYAQLASAVGNPKASRAVGGANGANPVAVIVPCHRVIAADGKLGGYAWGEAIKRELLRREARAANG